MGIHKNGFWLDMDSDGHIFDDNLSKALIDLIKEENIGSIVDLGCGKGDYARRIKDQGILCDCYDGNPNTRELSKCLCDVLDLSVDVTLGKNYDCVLSLEVGEHIPKEFEDNFLNNLVKHSNKLVVVSWAIVGQKGKGHVNERGNDYIEQKMKQLGCLRLLEKEKVLREKSRLRWFKNTIMVYKKA